MNSFEKLLAEFENELTFVFDKNIPKGLPGLICDKTIYINSDLPFDKSIATLAEEIGHYKTSSNKDITNYKLNRKEENKARHWGYNKLIPVDKLNDFIKNKEEVMAHEIAEEFEVPDDYVGEAINMYKQKGVL